MIGSPMQQRVDASDGDLPLLIQLDFPLFQLSQFHVRLQDILLRYLIRFVFGIRDVSEFARGTGVGIQQFSQPSIQVVVQKSHAGRLSQS